MAPNPNALRALAGAALAIVIAATAQAQTPAVSPQPAAITGEVQPIDLPTALRLAGANNIDLALVREALVQAQAQNERDNHQVFGIIMARNNDFVLNHIFFFGINFAQCRFQRSRVICLKCFVFHIQ